MSVGLGVLKKILEGDYPLSRLHEAGVTEKFFIKNEKKVYAFIVKHFMEYKVLPKIKTVEEELEVVFPEFSDEPLDYWIDQIKRRHKLNLAQKELSDSADSVADGKLDDVTNRVRSLYLSLSGESKTERVYRVGALARPIVQRYKNIRNSGETIYGVPFGLPTLDYISAGAQPGDSTAIIGRPATGKSYLLLFNALSGLTAGKRVMVETLEMTAMQCTTRLYGLKGGIPPDKIRKGKLSWWGERKLKGAIRDLDKSELFIYEGTFYTTFEDLLIKTEEIQPDILYVDGAYLLRTTEHFSSRWERVAATAEGLKSLALSLQIPVIGTYQFNRRGPGDLGNIAGSDAVGQLASIVLSLRCPLKKDDRGRSYSDCLTNIRVLEVIKGREGENMNIKLMIDLEKNVGIREVEDDDEV